MNFDPFVLQERYREGQSPSEKGQYSEAFRTPNGKKPNPPHAAEGSKTANTPPIQKLTSKITEFFHHEHTKGKEDAKSGASTPGVREPGQPTDLSKYKSKQPNAPFVNTAANPQKSSSIPGTAPIPSSTPKIEHPVPEKQQAQPVKPSGVSTQSSTSTMQKNEIRQSPAAYSPSESKLQQTQSPNVQISPQNSAQKIELKQQHSSKLTNEVTVNPYMAPYMNQYQGNAKQTNDLLGDLTPSNSSQNTPKLAQTNQALDVFATNTNQTPSKSVDPFMTPSQNRSFDNSQQYKPYGNATPAGQSAQKQEPRKFEIFNGSPPSISGQRSNLSLTTPPQKRANDEFTTFEIFGVPPMSPIGQNNFATPSPSHQNAQQKTAPSSAKTNPKHQFDQFDPLKSPNASKPSGPNQLQMNVNGTPRPSPKPVQQQTIQQKPVVPQNKPVQQQPQKQAAPVAQKPAPQQPKKEISNYISTPAAFSSTSTPVSTPTAPAQPISVPQNKPGISEASTEPLSAEKSSENHHLEKALRSRDVYAEDSTSSDMEDVPLEDPSRPKRNSEEINVISPSQQQENEVPKQEEPQKPKEEIHNDALLNNPFKESLEEQPKEEEHHDALLNNPFKESLPVEVKQEEKTDALSYNPFKESLPVEEKTDALSYNPFKETLPEQQKQEEHQVHEEKTDALSYNPFKESLPAEEKKVEEKNDALSYNPFKETLPEQQKQEEHQVHEEKTDALSYNPFKETLPVEEKQVEEKKVENEQLYNPFAKEKYDPFNSTPEQKLSDDSLVDPFNGPQKEMPKSSAGSLVDMMEGGSSTAPMYAVGSSCASKEFLEVEKSNSISSLDAVKTREIHIDAPVVLSTQQSADILLDAPASSSSAGSVDAIINPQHQSSVSSGSGIMLSDPLVVEISDNVVTHEFPSQEGMPKLDVSKPQTLVNNPFSEYEVKEEPKQKLGFTPFKDQPKKDDDDQMKTISYNPFANETKPKRVQEQQADNNMYNPFTNIQTNEQKQEKQELPNPDILSFNPFAGTAAPEPVKEAPIESVHSEQVQVEQKVEVSLPAAFSQTQTVPVQQEPVKEQPKDVLSFNPFTNSQQTSQTEVKTEISYNPFAAQQQETVQQPVEEHKDALSYNPFAETVPQQQETVHERSVEIVEEQVQVQQNVSISYNPFSGQPQEQKPEQQISVPSAFVQQQTVEQITVQEEHKDALSYNPFATEQQTPVQQQQETVVVEESQTPAAFAQQQQVQEEEHKDALSYNPFAAEQHIQETPVVESVPVQQQIEQEPVHVKTEISYNPFASTQPQETVQESQTPAAFAQQQTVQEEHKDALAYNPFAETVPQQQTVNVEPIQQEQTKVDISFNPFVASSQPEQQQPIQHEEEHKDALSYNPFAETIPQQPEPEEQEIVQERSVEIPAEEIVEEQQEVPAAFVQQQQVQEEHKDALSYNPFAEQQVQVEVKTEISYNPFAQSQEKVEQNQTQQEVPAAFAQQQQVQEEEHKDALSYNPFAAGQKEEVKEPPKFSISLENPVSFSIAPQQTEPVREEKVEVVEQKPVQEEHKDALSYNPFAETVPQQQPAPVQEVEHKDALSYNPFAETVPQQQEPAKVEVKTEISYNPFAEQVQQQPEPVKEIDDPFSSPPKQVKVEPKQEISYLSTQDKKQSEPVKEEEHKDALAFNPFAAEQTTVKETTVVEQVPVQQQIQEEPKDALSSNPFAETAPKQPETSQVSFNPFDSSSQEKKQEPEQKVSSTAEEHKDALSYNPFAEQVQQQPEPVKEIDDPFSSPPKQVKEVPKQEISYNPFASQEPVKEQKQKGEIVGVIDPEFQPHEKAVVIEVSEDVETDAFAPLTENAAHINPRPEPIHVKEDERQTVVNIRSVELDISESSVSSGVPIQTQSNPVYSSGQLDIPKNRSHDNLANLQPPADFTPAEFAKYVKSVLPTPQTAGARVSPKKFTSMKKKTKSAGPAGFNSLNEDKYSGSIQTDFNPFGNQVVTKHEDPKDALMFNPFGTDNIGSPELPVGSPMKRPPPIPKSASGPVDDDSDDEMKPRKRRDFNPLSPEKKKKKVSKKIIEEPIFNPFQRGSIPKSNSQHMIVGEKFNNDIDKQLKFLRTDNRMERVENSAFDVPAQEPLKNFDQSIAAKVLMKFCRDHFKQEIAFRF